MNIEAYRRRLLDLETTLSARALRERDAARFQGAKEAGDLGDASVSDESIDEELALSALNAEILQEVEDALLRIENGTFGRCVVDGGLIDEKRLDAAPWTPLCLKHQKQFENETALPMPTF